MSDRLNQVESAEPYALANRSTRTTVHGGMLLRSHWLPDKLKKAVRDGAHANLGPRSDGRVEQPSVTTEMPDLEAAAGDAATPWWEDAVPHHVQTPTEEFSADTTHSRRAIPQAGTAREAHSPRESPNATSTNLRTTIDEYRGKAGMADDSVSSATSALRAIDRRSVSDSKSLVSEKGASMDASDVSAAIAKERPTHTMRDIVVEAAQERASGAQRSTAAAFDREQQTRSPLAQAVAAQARANTDDAAGDAISISERFAIERHKSVRVSVASVSVPSAASMSGEGSLPSSFAREIAFGDRRDRAGRISSQDAAMGLPTEAMASQPGQGSGAAHIAASPALTAATFAGADEIHRPPSLDSAAIAALLAPSASRRGPSVMIDRVQVTVQAPSSQKPAAPPSLAAGKPATPSSTSRGIGGGAGYRSPWASYFIRRD